MKKVMKLFIFAVIGVMAISIYMKSLIPTDMYFVKGEQVAIKSLPMVTLKQSDAKVNAKAVSNGAAKLKYEASIFGIFPIKDVNITVGQAKKVSVAGTPFGIKMFSDGVMVVGFSEVLTSTGYQCPAKLSGIKMGDLIIKMNDTPTKNNGDVETVIKKTNGAPITVTFLRDEQQQTVTLSPTMDMNTASYRTGMWVRDSSAGVGTMTFYDLQRNFFAGLGHGIKDSDTQKDIRLLSGEIVPVKIIGLTKSKNGEAGELKGAFMSGFSSGNVLANSSSGVYGEIFSPSNDNMMEIASPQEVQPGAGYILTTINGTKPQKYEILIEKVSLTSANQSKNLVIKITDPELLSLTGGIVQGMSGSPIIQNGKLVGAVTHVFVNQVERGYGVFAQNMMFTLDTIENIRTQAAG